MYPKILDGPTSREAGEAIRVLHVFPGLVPPPRDPAFAEMAHLPRDITVDMLLPIWNRKPEEVEQTLGEGSYPRYIQNNLTYHLFLAGKHPLGSLRQKFAIFRFHVMKGLELAQKQRYDCVMAYNWGFAGLAAFILSRLVGAKLNICIANVPENAYRFNQFGQSWHYSDKITVNTRLASWASGRLFRFLVRRCDRLHLVYPGQLRNYPELQKVPVSIIPPFVAMSKIPHTTKRDGSILLVGAPWYLKGVDILIRAFQQIATEFPDSRLKLLGYFPDDGRIREMIGGSHRIEVLPARPNAEALQVIAECSIYVLASRTDAAPRVVFEAMAAGKPAIGSRVGGVPHYIRENETGLLFDNENVDELAARLRRLLRSPELQARFGANAYRIARTQYNESEWGRKMKEMIELTVHGPAAATERKRVPGITSAKPACMASQTAND